MKHVLYQPWGGLGDNLQFSTLPEELSKRGDIVCLSSRNAYRNSEIYHLTGLCNPHFKGICDDPPNLGHPAYPYEPSRSDNIINHWELCSGLTPTAGLPRIYLEPYRQRMYEDVVLVDLTSTSLSYDPVALRRCLDVVLERYPDKVVAQVRFNRFIPTHAPKLELPILCMDSLSEYWSVLFSVHTLVTVFSGASVLAAALLERWRKPEDFKPVVLRPPGHVKGYIFNGIEYIDVT